MWNLREEKINLTGIQGIVLGSVLQRIFDDERGFKTGALYCGYRGSPLGGLDKEIISKLNFLSENKIYFHPGLNEELAAAVIAGTQNYKLFAKPRDDFRDGVIGIWYGKGPGVDRSGDHIHHYNFAGTCERGGVVMLCGDDHMAKSSSLPHETSLTLVSWFVPVLFPSSVEEVVEYFIHSVNLSRYSGFWIALKIISDIADSYETVNLEKLKNIKITIPEIDFDVSLRWPDSGVDQEKRIYEQKIPAVLEYLKFNDINKIIKIDGNKTGIITIGNTYHSLMKLYDYNLEKINFDLLKIGCLWPIDKDKIKEFLKNKEKILIIEEKSGVFELFLKNFIFELDKEYRNIEIIGKNKVSPLNEIKSYQIKKYIDSEINYNKDSINEYKSSFVNSVNYQIPKRIPFYCGGCPHNTSTKLNEGDVALLGIGCHYLAKNMKDRPTITITPMGGEGTTWIGSSKFTTRDHIFVNLGDGTYFHSGILSIRAAVAARIKITYKILFNQAVAMTGGQKIDGELSLRDLVNQLLSEKVDKIYIVSHYYKEKKWNDFPEKTEIYDKKMFSEVMEKAKKINGVSVIIYDQMCATEKRRKQKRNIVPRENFRIFINEKICDNCGDCTRISNCLAIEVKNTSSGKVRRIDQSMCNLDTSCVNGYCPSFAIINDYSNISEKVNNIPVLEEEVEKENNDLPFSILTVGVGGTGISTLTKIISDAALIEGYNVKAMDHTGLAQRYGEINGKIIIYKNSENSLPDKEFDLLIGCDLWTSYSNYVNYDIKDFIINENYYNLPQIIYNENVDDLIDKMVDFFKNKNKENIVNFSDIAEKYNKKDRLNIIMLGASLHKIPLSENSIKESIIKNFPERIAKENIELINFGKYIIKNKNEFSNERDENNDLVKICYELEMKLLKYDENKKNFFLNSLRNLNNIKNEKLKIRVVKSLFDLLYVKNEKEISKLWIEYIENSISAEENFIKKMRKLKNLKIGLVLPWNRENRKKSFINGIIAYFMFKIINKFTLIDKLVLLFDRDHKTDEKYRKYAVEKLNDYLILGDEKNIENIVEKIEKVRGYGYIRINNIKKYFPEIFI